MTSNPFSTRFTRPGAIPFIFAEGQSPGTLLARLAEQNWWGQIIGEHGSGKSALVATLVPALEAAGRKVVLVNLRAGERRLPPHGHSAFAPATQLIIDGYEQLSWYMRRRVKSYCRRHGAGLLVTSHVNVGLPPLLCTEPSEDLAAAVVAKLLPVNNAGITRQDIAAAFAATGGNLRETLFTLYDVYQQRKAARQD